MDRIPFKPAYDQDLVSYHEPLSMISESFKMCRTNIEFSMIDRELKNICVTSSAQAEGKTLVTANLAISYAQIGRRVLLVDADLRRPNVHRLFSLSNRRGLTTMLLNGTDQDDAMQITQIENLTILTSGPIPPNPAELLMSAAMDRLIVKTRQEYDMVLFDCPPVGAVTDAAILASKVDGTIFVVRAGKVERKQLQRATDLLKQVKAYSLGFVLNGINPNNDNHYQYYYKNEYQAQTSAKRAKQKSSKRSGKHRIQSRQPPEPKIRNVSMPQPESVYRLPDPEDQNPEQIRTSIRHDTKRKNQLDSEDD